MTKRDYEHPPICRVCKQFELVSEDEIAHGMCEGCAIDLWEERRRKREQLWLEDDRNWEA